MDIQKKLEESGIFGAETGQRTWHIGTRPFSLAKPLFNRIERLGTHLAAFLRAVDTLYRQAQKNNDLAWVLEYLTAGKPDEVIHLNRLKKTRSSLPLMLRPDLLLTQENGLGLCEIDPVPGGPGMLACLSDAYASGGHSVINGGRGIIDGFKEAFFSDPSTLPCGVVVSEESQDYRAEMRYLAGRLREEDIALSVCGPQDLVYRENALYVQDADTPLRTLYRFFELFDLPNIPNAESIIKAVKKGEVTVTPPMKSYHEEKMLFAFLHSPYLRDFWQAELPDETFAELSAVVPRTWIFDPAVVPRTAAIVPWDSDKTPLADWRGMADMSQKQRHFIIKPSGFSPLAWGSHGAAAAFDLSGRDLHKLFENMTAVYPDPMYVVQDFMKSKRVGQHFLTVDGRDKVMEGRVRLSPFYFIMPDGSVELKDILAVICPADKKLLHGMKDAVVVPCAIA